MCLTSFLFPSCDQNLHNVVTGAMASGLAVCAFDLAAAHQHIPRPLQLAVWPRGAHESLVHGHLVVADQGFGKVAAAYVCTARHHACQMAWDAVIKRVEGYLLSSCRAQPASLPARRTARAGKPVR